MLITIASQTVELTKALRQFARQQATKLYRLNQRVTAVRVFLNTRTRSKLDDNALIKYVVSLPGKTIVIKRTAHDMYEGIVDVTDRVIRHVRKTKEKRIDRHRQTQPEVLAETSSP